MEKVSGIYMIQSISKPERVYIGSSVDIKNRWRQHLKTLRKGVQVNGRLQNHYNKYGIEDLTFSVVEQFEFTSKEHLLSREQYYINNLNPWFNIAKIAGSRLGIPSPNKGIKASEETCNKMRENSGRRGKAPWNKGKTGVYSKAALTTMSEAHIGNQYALGYKHTEEAIEKMVDSWEIRKQNGYIPKNKGISPSLGVRQNMRNAHLGKKQSEATIQKRLRSIRKPILQYDLDMGFIKEWVSIAEAQKELSISGISHCVGNTGQKTAGGFIWRYKMEQKLA
jgi:group I intron endonuclease